MANAINATTVHRWAILVNKNIQLRIRCAHFMDIRNCIQITIAIGPTRKLAARIDRSLTKCNAHQSKPSIVFCVNSTFYCLNRQCQSLCSHQITELHSHLMWTMCVELHDLPHTHTQTRILDIWSPAPLDSLSVCTRDSHVSNKL